MRINTETITVMVLSHNRKHLVIDALKSAISQDYPTEKIQILLVKSYRDHKVDNFAMSNGVEILNENAKSLGVKIGKGLEKAVGNYIAFLDDDDFWKPDKLKRAAEFVNQGRFSYYHSNQEFVDENGIALDRDSILKEVDEMDKAGVLKFNKKDPKQVLNRLFSLNPDFNSSSMVVKKSALLKHKELIESFDTALDTLIFYLSLAAGGDIVLDNEKKTYYRLHNRNVSSAGSKEECEEIKRIRDFADRRQAAFCRMRNVFREMGETTVAQLLEPMCHGLKIMSLVMGNKGNRRSILKDLSAYLRHTNKSLMLFRKDFLYYGLIYLFSPSICRNTYDKKHKFNRN